MALDTKPISLFSKNDGLGSWKLGKGGVSALTHAELYYLGRAVINRVVSQDPFMINVRVLDVSDAMEMVFPFRMTTSSFLVKALEIILYGRRGLLNRTHISLMQLKFLSDNNRYQT